MSGLSEFLSVFGSLSGSGFVTLIILGGFALAAFAIHSMAATTKGRR